MLCLTPWTWPLRRLTDTADMIERAHVRTEEERKITKEQVYIHQCCAVLVICSIKIALTSFLQTLILNLLPPNNRFLNNKFVIFILQQIQTSEYISLTYYR